MATINDKRIALLVECEKCFADVGGPCWNAAGTEEVDIHPERIIAAEKALDEYWFFYTDRGLVLE